MPEFLWCKSQTKPNNSHRWSKFILFIHVISETWKLLELLEELEWISEGKQLKNSPTKPTKPSYSNLLICDKREKSCELDDWSSPPWNGKQISEAVCNCKLSGEHEHCHGLSTIPHPKNLNSEQKKREKKKLVRFWLLLKDKTSEFMQIKTTPIISHPDSHLWRNLNFQSSTHGIDKQILHNWYRAIFRRCILDKYNMKDCIP